MAQRAYEPAADERPLKDLLSEMSDELKLLVHKEIELVKAETKDQIATATKAGGMLGGAALTSLLALALLSWAAAWGLAEVIPTGAAFAAVGVVYLLVAGLLYTVGRKRLADFKPVPAQTMQTIKEDVAVARSSIQRGANRPAGGQWYPPSAERTRHG
ncbi:MAG: phage holin family protein [Actinobacteria bacterium]|nr:phage holin family protein [Actinomycetota bacterium]